MKFRTDINCLRAYAVLAVILFHFGVPGASGGFVGVDIFFVISGYLMTGIIIESIEQQKKQGSHWLLRFYLARARRIIPALLALCVGLLAIGWFILPSDDYEQLGKHCIAAITFVSNIIFWQEAGYFDAESHDKWLLHTWSLSMEWQFYLIFPLLIMLIWKLLPGRRSITIALVIGTIYSFSFLIHLTTERSSEGFYLLPSRTWEFLIGGLMYLAISNWKPTDKVASWMEALGFVLILSSVALLNEKTTWPGSMTMVPVIGTILVLSAQRETSVWTRNVGLKKIGQWSYSIYLWHWPIMVLLILLEESENLNYIVCAIALTILLGWISYTLIEVPIRRNLVFIKPGYNTIGLACFAVVVVTFSLIVKNNAGFSSRLPKEVELIAAEANNFNQERRKNCHIWAGDDFRSCIHGGSKIHAILIGDSHASSVATAVQEALPDPNFGILTFTYTSCPTLFDVKIKNRPDIRCSEFNEWVMREIAQLPKEIPLIIVNRTSAYVFGIKYSVEIEKKRPLVYFTQHNEYTNNTFEEEFSRNLVESSCMLSRLRPVYLVRPIPEMEVDVPKIAARKQLLGQKTSISIELKDYHQRHELVWDSQDQARKECGVEILDPVPELCSEKRCFALHNGRPLYYDSHHLSEYGNKRLVGVFERIFK